MNSPYLQRSFFTAKKLFNAPKETISLAEGMPNDGSFPFEAINVVLKDGSSFTLQGGELAASLQYLPSQGYPPLLKTLKEFTDFVHKPPNWQNTDIIITNGSQCGISKSIEMCIEEGVPILVQNPLYTGTEIVVSYSKRNLLEISYSSDNPTKYYSQKIIIITNSNSSSF